MPSLQLLMASAILLITTTLTGQASGRILLSNGCPHDIYLWTSTRNSCDYGATDQCSTSAGAAPFKIPPRPDESTQPFSLALQRAPDWEVTPFKLKIFGSFDEVAQAAAHVEFKYGLDSTGTKKLRWSFTYSSTTVPGAAIFTAFPHFNTKVTPQGAGLGQGDCGPIWCPKESDACSDGPKKVEKPHICPGYITDGDTDVDMWISFCEPDSAKSPPRKREMIFAA